MLTFDHSKADGITKVVSNSRIPTAGLKIFGISLFKAAKAYFNLDLTVRWDCIRPANDHLQRLKLNQGYDDAEPGNDMNKLYYKLKIGYEIKVRKYSYFCYKCKKCETVVNKQGHMTEGPDSCKSGRSYFIFFRNHFFQLL